MSAGRDNTPVRVLILGGSGVFGSRIARLLAAEPGVEVIVAGRDRDRAQIVCREIEESVAGAHISARALDRDQIAEDLRSSPVEIVIHAAGPFHDQDYGVARAALANGAHYLDLADDRSFVQHFERLDRFAKSNGRVALTGLSSVPALSSAVVAALAEGLAHVAEIRIGITPGSRAPRGQAVISGVLAGVGQRSDQRKAGAWLPVRGWRDLRRRRLEVSGQKPLRRWFSHCEVPDPDCLTARYPTAETITFHAGLELSLEHLGLWMLSFLVSMRLVKSLRIFTRALTWIDRLLCRLGTDRGGMFVELVGRDAQRKWVRRSWTLIAGAGDGPIVPAIPAALVAKQIASGRAPAAGARAALAVLPLKAIEEAFAPFDIKTERTETALDTPLFARLLGPSFGNLPSAVRDTHLGLVALRFEGEAHVLRGNNPLSRMIGRVFGLPPGAENTPVTVMIEPQRGSELWTRTFGGHGFKSRMQIVERREHTALAELFGPFRFEMTLGADSRKLTMQSAKAYFFGLPWPRALAPRISAEERAENARFVFDVRVELPLCGLLVHYTGWLMPLSVSLRPQAMRRMEVSPAIESRAPTWPN